jgi:hypothetical protein
VLAVPRSIAMSADRTPSSLENMELINSLSG